MSFGFDSTATALKGVSGVPGERGDISLPETAHQHGFGKGTEGKKPLVRPTRLTKAR